MTKEQHIQRIRSAITDAGCDGVEANLCDMVAADRGWNPLEIGNSMTISFCDGKEYTITRNADRQYISPSAMEFLIQESPVPPMANVGPAKPPFELQKS